MALTAQALVALLALVFSVPLGLFLHRLSGRLSLRAWARRVMSFFNGRLNRPQRGEKALLIRGAVALALILLPLFGITAAFGAATAPAPGINALAALLLAAPALESGRLFQFYRRLARAAQGTDIHALHGVLAMGRERYGFGTRRLDQLDRTDLLRLATDQGAIGFGQGVIAPLFWLAFFGLTGLATSLALRGCVMAFRRAGVARGAFAFAAERLDWALGYLPVRLAALTWCLAAAFVPGASWRGGLLRWRYAGEFGIDLNDRVMLAVASGTLSELYQRPMRLLSAFWYLIAVALLIGGLLLSVLLLFSIPV